MPRSTNNVAAKKRRKKILDSAKGYFGGKSKLYRTAKLAVEKSGLYAYRDRKVRKREFRKLWIVRINAAVRANGLSYSKFINGLAKSNIQLNRKSLAYLAMNDKQAFDKICEQVKSSLAN